MTSGFQTTWTMVRFSIESPNAARRVRRKIRSMTGWGSRRMCQHSWILIPRSMARLEPALRPLLPEGGGGRLDMIAVTDKQVEHGRNFFGPE